MKARISSPLPKVAVGVNISEEKAAVLTEVMSAVGGEFRRAEGDCGADTIGYFCGLKGYAASGERLDVKEELLIFSGLDSRELNKVVVALRDKGCSIPLKAVVTPQNKDWTVSALAVELMREHELMTARAKGEGNEQK